MKEKLINKEMGPIAKRVPFPHCNIDTFSKNNAAVFKSRYLSVFLLSGDEILDIF